MLSLKRKKSSAQGKQDIARKRKKVLISELPWKEVARPKEAGLDEFEGMLMLEEVDDVEITFEETDKGRIARFNLREEDTPEEEEEWGGIPDELIAEVAARTSTSTSPTTEAHQAGTQEDISLPEWSPLALDSWLVKGLAALGYDSPTPIQNQAIPFASQGRDVIGIAQTGSGKTLAYGLPILQRILNSEEDIHREGKRKLKALILAPTRELALQVSTHLNDVLTPLVKSTKEAEGAGHSPRVSVAAIVGGMSPQKQKRILDRGVDILVATPGRLWDIMTQDDDLSSQIRRLRFLVLDEADRMIEQGHFQELDNILRLTLRVPDIDSDQMPKDAELVGDNAAKPRDDLQTFVFSATMSKDLQRNLKKFKRKTDKKAATTLDELLLRLDFRDSEPKVIDISPVGGVVSTLKDSKIVCLPTDKDVYLYYFLLRYPGRSLIFLSSIDGIRRLAPLLALLHVTAFPLHSQLEQRQRLKNLDRFKSSENAVLLATDVAARGLDIPAVDHVLHYQVPRSSDTYVHRNGRTARASREGFAMLMCAPDERKLMKGLFSNLGRSEEDVPELTVDHHILNKLKERVELAREIENAQHKLRKENHEQNWLQETADALGVVIDSDDEEHGGKSSKRKARDQKVAGLKAQLYDLLSRPLIASGVSTRYITSGSKPIAEDLLEGNFHEAMVGVDKSNPRLALSQTKPRKKKQPRKKEKKERKSGQ